MEKVTTFEVGKPFPVSISPQEGTHMELWDTGLNVIIQMPALRLLELKAFEKCFEKYYYLETHTSVPIAVWLFDFPVPFGPIDCNFNARIVKPEYIDCYLDITEGVKNLITFYLVDRQILRAIKAVGLRPKSITLFHETITKQLNTEYSQVDYDRCLSVLFEFSTEELFTMGNAFHKNKRAALRLPH